MDQINKLNKNRKIKKTQATKFLLPLVNTNNDDKYPSYLKDGIENCYLYNDDQIIIIYEITNDTKDLDEQFSKNDLFVDSIDIVGNEQKVGYIFNIPEQHKNIIELFKEGKYSEFSDEYKQQVLSFWDIDQSENVFHGILYKTQQGKEYSEQEGEGDKAEGEYWPKPNMEMEQFSNMY